MRIESKSADGYNIYLNITKISDNLTDVRYEITNESGDVLPPNSVLYQNTKGLGHECLDLSKLGTFKQKYISMKKLLPGENYIWLDEPGEPKIKGKGKSTALFYTTTELATIAELQNKIAAIRAIAEAREAAKPNLDVDISTLSEQDKLDMIKKLKAMLGMPATAPEEAEEETSEDEVE